MNTFTPNLPNYFVVLPDEHKVGPLLKTAIYWVQLT